MTILKSKKGVCCMNTMIIMQIGSFGIIVAIMELVLKKAGRDTEAFILVIVATTIGLMWATKYMQELFTIVSTFGNIS